MRSLARWWGGGGGGGLEAEAVAGGVKDPGVEVGALHAGVQPQRLAGQLAGRQRARVGQRAVRLALVTKIFLVQVQIFLHSSVPQLTLTSHFSFHSWKSLRPLRSVGCWIHCRTWDGQNKHVDKQC